MSRRRTNRLYFVYLRVSESEKYSVYAKDLESLKETLAKKFGWERCMWHRKETSPGYPEGAMHFELERSVSTSCVHTFPLLVIPD